MNVIDCDEKMHLVYSVVLYTSLMQMSGSGGQMMPSDGDNNDDLEEDDNHFCMKCKTVISGIENYIQHRRSKCASVDKVRGHSIGVTWTVD